jgi:hypothetical protein
MKLIFGVVGAAALAISACSSGKGSAQQTVDTSASENLYEGYLWSIFFDAAGRGGAMPDDGAYPVVLADVAAQRELGLMESNFGPYAGEEPLENKCFYYGDGGARLSVSDAFLDRYRAAGFTLETLCMALVSGIRHHPESGERLATVQVADIDALSSPDYFGEPGPLGVEHPIEIPTCFRNGAPLTDCLFAFDPWSGARLTAAETRRIATEGERIAGKLAALRAAGKFARPCGAGVSPVSDETCYNDGMTTSGYRDRAYDVGAAYPDLLPLNGFYVISDAYALGFAYAIGADGAAGPSASMESVSLVLSGKNRATSARLKALTVLAAAQ